MAEKDKLPLKNYAHCDSFDTVTFNYIIVLHGADTLVFVLYNTVHLNNNISYIIYRYIYNTPTYGCTSMLTFILNVLGEVLGIGNLYCRPFYSAGSGPCARPRDFENRLPNDVLANFGRSLPPLILEQTPTALLVDGQRHSFETAPNRSSTSPRAFFDNGRAASEDFTPPPGTHDRSNVETGERRDMYTLTFFNRL